jgi:hypothetical protein
MARKPVNRKAVLMHIPDADTSHPKSEDCPCCEKDKHNRATGYYVSKIKRYTCKLCKGTSKRKNKQTHKLEYCTSCLDGVFPWRSKLLTCRECNGTGRKSSGTALEEAFKEANKKALLM